MLRSPAVSRELVYAFAPALVAAAPAEAVDFLIAEVGPSAAALHVTQQLLHCSRHSSCYCHGVSALSPLSSHFVLIPVPYLP